MKQPIKAVVNPMFQYNDYKIYLACGKTDMRKSIDGLCGIVQDNFQLDPREKAMFAFCNQRRNRIKLLVWEDNGFWVHFKRLEKFMILLAFPLKRWYNVTIFTSGNGGF